MHIVNFPKEVLSYLFLFLRPHERNIVSLVCKRFLEITNDESHCKQYAEILAGRKLTKRTEKWKDEIPFLLKPWASETRRLVCRHSNTTDLFKIHDGYIYVTDEKGAIVRFHVDAPDMQTPVAKITHNNLGLAFILPVESGVFCFYGKHLVFNREGAEKSVDLQKNVFAAAASKEGLWCLFSQMCVLYDVDTFAMVKSIDHDMTIIGFVEMYIFGDKLVVSSAPRVYKIDTITGEMETPFHFTSLTSTFSDSELLYVPHQNGLECYNPLTEETQSYEINCGYGSLQIVSTDRYIAMTVSSSEVLVLNRITQSETRRCLINGCVIYSSKLAVYQNRIFYAGNVSENGEFLQIIIEP